MSRRKEEILCEKENAGGRIGAASLPAVSPAFSANSAEPPRLSVLIVTPPEDLELSLVFSLSGQEEPVKAEARQLAWEGYYLFRPYFFPNYWEEPSPRRT